MRYWFILCFMIISCFSAITISYAVDNPDEMLKNPALEKRAEYIGSQLRCLVCQNESIEDSSADLARDLRKAVRQRVSAGDNNQQVIDWMVQRYGNFIRLQPPFNLTTALLWGMPVLALLVGGFAAFRLLRRSKPSIPPLNKDEEKRLSELMKDRS